MITYLTDQRRALRWTGANWIEEVLAASGVAVDDSGFTVISGTEVQETLSSIDSILSGLEASASGILVVEDVVNVSGVTGEVLNNLDVVTMPNGSDSAFRFTLNIPAQPLQPINVRVAFAPRASGTGTFSGTLAYNIFNTDDDLTVGSGVYADSIIEGQAISNSDFEELKYLSFAIPAADFSGAGSAPFILDCKFTRNTGFGGEYTHDISVIEVYADNVPGGIAGNTAGYVSGDLEVTGDLTVDGYLIVNGGDVPALNNSPGVSGSIVVSDNFLYVAAGTNLWRRIPLGSF